MFKWSDLTPLPSPPAAPPAQGSMGVVVAATHRGRRLAVKVWKTAALASGEFERALCSLQAEMAKMALASEGGLNDGVVVPAGLVEGAATPAWVAALGHHASACVSASQLWGIAMKWEEGGTLPELLHSPTRAWGAGVSGRLQLCAQLAGGVAALHAAGVIHGDVKGENVLLSDRGASPRPRFTDFGFAELRTAASSARASSALGEKRGTWPYMAPEMLTEEAGVSRSGDVFALGTLCWEVLTGKQPWADSTERKRMAAHLKGAEAAATLLLSSPPLPVDTPAAVKALLGECLATEKAARPRAARVAEVLHQAAQAMASGAFDIFLSHAWVDGAHAPLTTEVYLRLIDAGYRVWLDTAEMGHDLVASMTGGIEKSGCVVALLSERYGTRPNCLLELRAAKDAGKPVVACLADAAPGWFPAAGSEVAALVNTAQRLLPDLRAAAAVDWRAGVGAAEREVLTKAPTALPKVLQLVREVLGRGAPEPPLSPLQQKAPAAPEEGGARAGGGGGASNGGVAPQSLPPASPSPPAHAAAGVGGKWGGPPPPAHLELPAAPMGAARVVALMSAGGADAGVARAGAEALCSIAGDPAGAEACVDAGAPQALAAALTAHAGEAAVCEAACTALYQFALHAPARRDDIVHAGRWRHSVKPELGAVPPLAAVYARHAGSARACAQKALKILHYSSEGTLKQ
jgi:hypothetical protein